MTSIKYRIRKINPLKPTG